jgi:opacity protein-like surface antigen
MNRSTLLALVTAALLVSAARSSSAQSGDGFLFHRPDVSVSLRAGYSHADAGSDVFDDVTSNLTLNRKDFSSLTVGGDFAFHATDRVDLVLAGGYSRSNHKSEFRDFVDNNDLPIEQMTTFERLPITANVRVNLSQPGRTVGRLAWIPSRVVPYIGAGVGAMRYRFRQDGDFVDFNTNAVFSSVLDSEGWALVEQAMAGVDYNFSPQWGLSLDARYMHARGDLDAARYKGYDKLDLSGATATIGLSFRL